MILKQQNEILQVRTYGRSLTLITVEIQEFIKKSSIQHGILTLWCKHTSASLLVQENADPAVQDDILVFFDALVPDSRAYHHNLEGADDMPAHLKTSLTTTQLTIPIMGGETTFGRWQGLYLFEHRLKPQIREIAMHIIGDT